MEDIYRREAVNVLPGSLQTGLVFDSLWAWGRCTKFCENHCAHSQDTIARPTWISWLINDESVLYWSTAVTYADGTNHDCASAETQKLNQASLFRPCLKLIWDAAPWTIWLHQDFVLRQAGQPKPSLSATFLLQHTPSTKKALLSLGWSSPCLSDFESHPSTPHLLGPSSFLPSLIFARSIIMKNVECIAIKMLSEMLCNPDNCCIHIWPHLSWALAV